MRPGSGATNQGLLIAIEGIDGSGKGTQAARLQASLTRRGLKAALISFPRYQETFFGARIGDFLNGRFGSLEEVHPFLAATLFAGDRLESRSFLNEAIVSHDVVVLDRMWRQTSLIRQPSALERIESS